MSPHAIQILRGLDPYAVNQSRQNELRQRAKLAYDAYTVAAGERNPIPFVSLWPRQTAGWIAVVEALEPPERTLAETIAGFKPPGETA